MGLKTKRSIYRPGAKSKKIMPKLVESKLFGQNKKKYFYIKSSYQIILVEVFKYSLFKYNDIQVECAKL